MGRTVLPAQFLPSLTALENRYLALIGELPESNHVLHAAAKTPDVLLIFDAPGVKAYQTANTSPGSVAAGRDVALAALHA